MFNMEGLPEYFAHGRCGNSNVESMILALGMSLMTHAPLDIISVIREDSLGVTTVRNVLRATTLVKIFANDSKLKLF